MKSPAARSKLNKQSLRNQINLEFKIVSTAAGNNGYPLRSYVLDVHLSQYWKGDKAATGSLINAIESFDRSKLKAAVTTVKGGPDVGPRDGISN